MLQTSFYMLVDYIALGWPECEAYLERIGVAHGKHGRDIAPLSTISGSIACCTPRRNATSNGRRKSKRPGVT